MGPESLAFQATTTCTCDWAWLKELVEPLRVLRRVRTSESHFLEPTTSGFQPTVEATDFQPVVVQSGFITGIRRIGGEAALRTRRDCRALTRRAISVWWPAPN